MPAQYDPKQPACVMVFQDGKGYVDPKGSFRVPTVFDNLIHKKEMPVTIGIFINPGSNTRRTQRRSYEYDTLSDQYARFLEKEILPEVEKHYNLRHDPIGRAIGGISSGGICSFTVAWERPDLFSKVLSHVGSFTNIRGGDVYPGKIRKTPRKPIRVFLQDGSGDLNNPAGNWPLANQQMASALEFAKLRLPLRLRRRRTQRQTRRGHSARFAALAVGRGAALATRRSRRDRQRNGGQADADPLSSAGRPPHGPCRRPPSRGAHRCLD